ncbi:MBL fold metallo-hydrolase [Dethiobacter alkaliphilus]|uniref:Beta-lactamase domain protein n=1 Tax=Dethiobacter alkaliphilus AHT 1 TaxID=555088 RepID=C0GGH1_DETAL|nr:MBL fold metallo-hydrolase [Dethiobacter alkaliphilus]EEG77601.1 beta-lactamase domain protein [Dethiobacter alkaliphilus AHT 1]
MLLKRMEVGSFAANCYLLACDETKEGVVVDPGADARRILKMVEDNQVNVKYIINTHGHVDHVGANEEVREALGAPILIHEADGEMCKKPHASLSTFLGKKTLAEPDRLIKGKDTFTVGNLTIEVIETPGHTKGCVTLLVDGKLFTGDTLFAGSIGRTDLPGGSFDEIIRSIKEKLLVFPDETPVFPGHGPESTIGDEKQYNPFLR